MSDQSQPAILPATLPAGTRTRYGNEATSELTLTDRSGRHWYSGFFAGYLSVDFIAAHKHTCAGPVKEPR